MPGLGVHMRTTRAFSKAHNLLNWYSGRHCAAIQCSGLRACAAQIEGRTGDTHLWCVQYLVEHKRLSVKTDNILATQQPMLYTFTRWLCYNTDTSIDPTSIIVIIGEQYGVMTRYHLMRCLCLSLFHIHSTSMSVLYNNGSAVLEWYTDYDQPLWSLFWFHFLSTSLQTSINVRRLTIISIHSPDSTTNARH